MAVGERFVPKACRRRHVIRINVFLRFNEGRGVERVGRFRGVKRDMGSYIDRINDLLLTGLSIQCRLVNMT